MEEKPSPDTRLDSRRLRAGASVRRRFTVAAGTLAGGWLALAPVQAQETLPEIEERIEAVFSLVLANPLDLAVPLTRRALARRSIEYGADLAPLAYREADPTGRGAGEGEAEEPLSTATLSEPEIEQGSAEELARLPRPRPTEPGAEPSQDAPGAALAAGASFGANAADADVPTLIGQPLDLVAGAAIAMPAALQPPSSSHQLLAAATASDAALVAAPAPPSEASAAELIASDACRAPDAVADRDGDLERHAGLLSGSGFCIEEEKFKERRRLWTIHTIATGRPGPLWVVIHDDEDMSFDNAVHALSTYGGELIALDTGGKRNQDGVDPNRNFSAGGIGCRKLGDDAAPRFSSFFKKRFEPDRPIIALHNNFDGHVSTGGLGHVSMRSVPKDMKRSPAPDPDGPLAGDYALVLLAVADESDPVAKARTAALSAGGINVVLEPVRKGRGDCSLSNFAVLTGNANYFNVTVDHDESEKQRQMVDAIMSGLSDAVASQ